MYSFDDLPKELQRDLLQMWANLNTIISIEKDLYTEETDVQVSTNSGVSAYTIKNIYSIMSDIMAKA